VGSTSDFTMFEILNLFMFCIVNLPHNITYALLQIIVDCFTLATEVK